LPLPVEPYGGIAAALAVSGLLLCLSAPLAAQAPATPPAADSTCPNLTLGPAIPPTPDRSGAPILIYAQELDAGKTRLGEARGAVELFRADQHMTTERILYDPTTEVVTVPGKVDYRDQQVWFRGEQASYSFLEETGWFSAIDYGLTGSVANGHAERVELVGGNTSILHRLNYTTCPGERPDRTGVAARGRPGYRAGRQADIQGNAHSLRTLFFLSDRRPPQEWLSLSQCGPQ